MSLRYQGLCSNMKEQRSFPCPTPYRVRDEVEPLVLGDAEVSVGWADQFLAHIETLESRIRHYIDSSDTNDGFRQVRQIALAIRRHVENSVNICGWQMPVITIICNQTTSMKQVAKSNFPEVQLHEQSTIYGEVKDFKVIGNQLATELLEIVRPSFTVGSEETWAHPDAHAADARLTWLRRFRTATPALSWPHIICPRREVILGLASKATEDQLMLSRGTFAAVDRLSIGQSGGAARVGHASVTCVVVTDRDGKSVEARTFGWSLERGTARNVAAVLSVQEFESWLSVLPADVRLKVDTAAGLPPNRSC